MKARRGARRRALLAARVAAEAGGYRTARLILDNAGLPDHCPACVRHRPSRFFPPDSDMRVCAACLKRIYQWDTPQRLMRRALPFLPSVASHLSTTLYKIGLL